MTEVDIDKLTEQYTMKIPEILKVQLDKLSAPSKSELKMDIMYVMARHLHKNNFDPEQYLSSRN